MMRWINKRAFPRTFRMTFIVVVLLLSADAVYAWSGPPAGTPPACPTGQPGCDAPLNISNNFQSKDGNLMVNASGSYATGFNVPYGNVGIGGAGAIPGYKLTVSSGAIGGNYALLPNYAGWASYGTGDGTAAIYNDNGSYKTLMIVGNNSAGGVRTVGVWDNLNVSGNLTSAGQAVCLKDGTNCPGTSGVYLPLAGGTMSGNVVINNGSPTIYFADSDQRSAMIHNNSNLLYVLRGCGTGSLDWCTTKGAWPLVINLEDNNISMGGDLIVNGTAYANGQALCQVNGTNCPGVNTSGLVPKDTWWGSTYYGNNGDIYLGYWGIWLSTELSNLTNGYASNAGTVGGIDPSRIVYGDNSTKTSSFGDPNSWMSSGFYNNYTGTNVPYTSWWSLLNVRHVNENNNYGMQILGNFYNNGDLYYRIQNGDNFSGGWGKIWTAFNFDPNSRVLKTGDTMSGTLTVNGGTYGVIGQSIARNGYGGQFNGSVGVFGYGINLGGGPPIGVYGSGGQTAVPASSSIGIGVRGWGDDTGTYGTGGTFSGATGVIGTGSTYGVYATGGTYGVRGISTYGYGVSGYGPGNAGVVGNGYDGVEGTGFGAAGIGGRFEGTIAGVYAVVTGTSAASAAGHFLNASSGFGVWGSGGSGGYDFYAAGAGIDYGTASSIRWKSNVQELTGSLDTIMKLKGISYNMDQAHGGGHQIGFIGEDIGKYYPEIVSFDASSTDPSYYVTGMDYSKMTPVLLEGIKELKIEKDTQILDLQNQVNELKKEIEDLKSKK